MKKLILLLVLCLGYQLSFSQDSCAAAVAVTAGTTTVGTIVGTDIPTPNCMAGTAAVPLAEWYKYTPTQNYTVTISSDLQINTGKDTRVYVYTGTCGNLVCYAFDDDAGVIGNGYLSIVTFNVTAGTTYYLSWDNRWNSNGFDFQLTENPYIPPVIAFTSQAISTTSSICSVADMDGDYLDDIVTVETNQMTVQKQLTTGGFNPVVYALPALSTTPGWSIAAGDYNKDGFNDLVFGNSSRLTVVKSNPGGASYTEVPYPQGIFTQRTNFVDINNDGNLDLWACHDTAQSYSYRNDGEGNLLFDTTLMPTLAVGGNYQSQWTDYDNDGDIDMYLSKCRAGAAVGDPQRINLLYKNNGNGTFTESGALAGVNDGSQSWSSAIEDYDNDGDMDILLSNISDTNKLYRNNGDGTFTDVFAASGIDAQVGSWELQAADFNNDGRIDFLWQNNKELYLNNGNLTFTGYDLPFSEGGLGDLNNDGFMDVQFNNIVYLNTPNGNNWIKINLHGIQSNTNGIGARVEIYGPFGKQIREIKSGNGFSHQSTLNAHFGLGADTSVTQIKVIWPSGTIDTILNPSINQATLVVEGASLAVNQFNNTAFSVYPIPAKNSINVKTANNISMSTAQVYDLNGKLVLDTKLTNNTINVETLSKGTYILKLRDTNDKDYAQKIIIE
ncbi:FG-GAP-like repeat-containing protein [Flavobacterium sp. SUN046]|uniref:CRTAC1 family protein n=1 Tax=Flavobacterium sp. SUN046 TaxID=3002440 RepID=UPI002DBD6DC4|nr:FG-GAP-like repeat-containing protein [Flavobacterium sp. SUN046]MEC4050041.1 FG-GAP-like repeat-containing protein [Flavobacterium sp. SUN046]